MVINKELIEAIKNNFFKKLQAKTGWGRNEIMAMYKDTITEEIMKIIDQGL